MANVINQILTTEDITKKRTPLELFNWWTKKSDELYYSSSEGREAFRLHLGKAKIFMEEMHPLSLFGKRKYDDTDNVIFQSVIGNQSYDAILTDARSEPILQSYIEITQSHDGEEQYLRDFVLFNTGSVYPYGNVIKTGTKHSGIQVEVQPHIINVEKAAEKDLSNILRAAKKKAGKPYPANTSLIIFFDDRLHFPRVISDTQLDNFVKKNILCLNLNFSSLFLVGFDHVFREFIF
jgi:hypothetical protein